MKKLIRKAEEKDFTEILRLNEADVEMLSPQDERLLARMAELSELFQVVEIDGEVAAFQIIFRESSGYWSENYAWFCERYPKFLYVDRIVVRKDHRKDGLGRELYEEVMRRAEETHVPLIAAEIDIAPQYNAASMAFHKRMGFAEVGTKPFKEHITVSLQIKDLVEGNRIENAVAEDNSHIRRILLR